MIATTRRYCPPFMLNTTRLLATKLAFLYSSLTSLVDTQWACLVLVCQDRNACSASGWIFQNSDLRFEEVLDAPSLVSQKEEIQDLLDRYRVTAYNKAFDFGFLKDRGFQIKELDCPMHLSTPIVKLPAPNGRRGFKWPKVEEAWDYFFGDTGYIEAHRGLDDAIHEAKIVYKLYQMGEFPYTVSLFD